MGHQDMKSIREVLEKITSQKGWEKGGIILRWQDLWRRCVGPYVAGKTEVVGVRGRKAVVAVAHSVLASELALQKPTILEKLREAGGKGAPTDLIFRVEPDLGEKTEPQTRLRDLDPAAQKEIEELTASIEDREIKERFTRILVYSFQREEKR